MLPEDVRDGIWLLLILGNADNRLIIVLDLNIESLSRILSASNCAENAFYLRLHFIYVNVTDHHNSLLVRTIPLLIIVANCLIREIVHYFHRTYWKTNTIEIPRIHFRKYGLIHTHLSIHSTSPLFMDDSPFVVNVIIL